MEIKLVITAQSKEMPDDVMEELFDLSFDNGGNGIEMYPKRDMFPMPWDAACYIENGEFIIDGDLGQQGSNRAWAKVGIPLANVMNYLDLAIHVDEDQNNDGYVDRINEILDEYGWK